VQVVLDELEKHPLPRHQKPAYPNYHKGQNGAGKSGEKSGGGR
jgi:hypothetical protein